MKKIFALLALLIAGGAAITAKAGDPSVLVTTEGEQIRAYNVDLPNGKYIYYTKTTDEEGDVSRILKENVLVIRLSDGSKVDPMDEGASAAVQKINGSSGNSRRGAAVAGRSDRGDETIIVGVGHKKATSANPAEAEPAEAEADAYQPTVYEALGGIFSGRNNSRHVRAGIDGRDILEFRIIEGTKQVALVEPTKGLEYEGYGYHIPDYVMINGEQYTMTTVDEDAFKWKWGNNDLTELTLPRTLKYIGDYAFYGCVRIPEIIIPDSVVTIGKWAFGACGSGCSFFKELYIPTTVRSIGDEAFRNVGNRRSYRGYFQGKLTSCPSYITLNNCTDYGIDEEALERYMYEQRRK